MGADRTVQCALLRRIAQLNELEEGNAKLDRSRQQEQDDDQADGKFHQALSAFRLEFFHRFLP
jgi:hypothetical protein